MSDSEKTIKEKTPAPMSKDAAIKFASNLLFNEGQSKDDVINRLIESGMSDKRANFIVKSSISSRKVQAGSIIVGSILCIVVGILLGGHVISIVAGVIGLAIGIKKNLNANK